MAYWTVALASIYRYLDFINLMNYDFAGSWSPTTGHNSPLYATTNAANPHNNVVSFEDE